MLTMHSNVGQLTAFNGLVERFKSVCILTNVDVGKKKGDFRHRESNPGLLGESQLS